MHGSCLRVPPIDGATVGGCLKTLPRDGGAIASCQSTAGVHQHQQVLCESVDFEATDVGDETTGGVSRAAHLFADLGMLVVEGRCPGGPRGFQPGPHCVLVCEASTSSSPAADGHLSSNERHVCDPTQFTCRRDVQLRRYMRHLCHNAVPMCLDVLLCVNCQHYSSTSHATNHATKCHQILVEQWNIRIETGVRQSRSHSGCDTSWLHLLHSLRDYMDNSLVARWLAASGGVWPRHLLYRVRVPGDATTPATASSSNVSDASVCRCPPGQTRSLVFPAVIVPHDRAVVQVSVCAVSRVDTLCASVLCRGVCLCLSVPSCSRVAIDASFSSTKIKSKCSAVISDTSVGHKANVQHSPAVSQNCCDIFGGTNGRCQHSVEDSGGGGDNLGASDSSPIDNEEQCSLRKYARHEKATCCSGLQHSQDRRCDRIDVSSCDVGLNDTTTGDICRCLEEAASKADNSSDDNSGVSTEPCSVDNPHSLPPTSLQNHQSGLFVSDVDCDGGLSSSSGCSSPTSSPPSSPPWSTSPADATAHTDTRRQCLCIRPLGGASDSGYCEPRCRRQRWSPGLTCRVQQDCSACSTHRLASLVRRALTFSGTPPSSHDHRQQPETAGRRILRRRFRHAVSPDCDSGGSGGVPGGALTQGRSAESCEQHKSVAGCQVAAVVSSQVVKRMCHEPKRDSLEPLSADGKRGTPVTWSSDGRVQFSRRTRLPLNSSPAPIRRDIIAAAPENAGTNSRNRSVAKPCDVACSVNCLTSGDNSSTLPPCSSTSSLSSSLSSSPLSTPLQSPFSSSSSSSSSAPCRKCHRLSLPPHDRSPVSRTDPSTDACRRSGDRLPSHGQHRRHRRRQQLSGLLGSLEETMLRCRLAPSCSVAGFVAELGASGSFQPRHIRRAVTVLFYSLCDNETTTAPYMGHISLPARGYRVPRRGTVQLTLFNPHGTVVKMFVVPYDLTAMPPDCHTFIRQRTLYMPVDNAADPAAADGWHDASKQSKRQSPGSDNKWLRYLIHLRFASGGTGRVYLHSDIRVIVMRKCDEDTASLYEQARRPFELRSFVHAPDNPRYSPR